MMKIAHITTSLTNGGAEAAMFRLICANNEHSHIVISLTGTGVYEDRLKDAGIHVYCIQFKGVGVPLKPIFELRNILKAENPDVIQGWMYHANLIGGLIARSLGIRNIFWNLRTSDPKRGEAGRLTHWINLACAKLSNVIPKKIISCAHKAKIAHVQIGYSADQIQTVCNGYDLNYLRFSEESRSSLRAQWGVGKEVFLIGLVARWHPQKDHRLFFEAVRKVNTLTSRPWKVVLVGSDMDSGNNDLIQHITNTGLSEHVLLVGVQDNIPAVMSALDLHVLTSKDEGFPNVLAEAMSCHTPCVTTDVGDAAFIVGDTGWVSPIGDVDKLATNLSKAFDLNADIDQWRNLGELARLRIENEFSIESMVEQYNSIWQQSTIPSN